VRILYIVTAFPRHSGDVITPWLLETIGRLRQVGVEVEVLAPSYRGLPGGRSGSTEVHRFRYAPRAIETLTHDQTVPDRIRQKPWYLLLVPFYLLFGTLAAAKLVRTGRFDAVHAFWPVPHSMMALLASGRKGPPVVSTFFGVELTWLRRDFPILSPVVRWIVRRSAAVTVISRHTAAEVRRFEGSVPLEVIPFGAAALPRGHTAVPTRVAGPFGLLFVGRLVERKGVAVLLRAVALLSRKRDLRLTIVGDGPLRRVLELEADALGVGDRVRFLGFVPDSDMTDHFRAADALVLPAVQDSKGDVEGLGVVLIEAIAHGKPVIASDSGGIPDIVIDGESGLLVPPGSPEALAAAIERLLADPGLRSRLVEGGLRHVEANFSWSTIVTRLVALYRSVSRVPSRSPTGGDV
jgi:glycosyltransferase involved in cell wall biosynthesis